MFRIKMNLDNQNAISRQNISSNPVPKSITNFVPKYMSLSAPMIDRVHKAKPGCSACGKRVA
jgi:hypothetical protein